MESARKGSFTCTPFKLTLAVAITEYVQSSKTRTSSGSSSPGFATLPLAEARTVLVKILALVQSTPLPYSEFLDRFKDCPAFLDIFSHRISDLSAGGIDKLCDFLSSISQDTWPYFQPPASVRRSSILGRHIRIAATWYERVSFTEICRLQKDFKDYLAGKAENFRQPKNSVEDLSARLSRQIEEKCFEDASDTAHQLFGLPASLLDEKLGAYHPGLMAMANLAYRFGHRELGMKFLNDAIGLAHQTNDTEKLLDAVFDFCFTAQHLPDEHFEDLYSRTYPKLDEAG